MKITRYDHDNSGDCYGMIETQNGDYVRFDDVETIIKQNQELLSALKDFVLLAKDSKGLAGVHLNGDLYDLSEEIAAGEEAIVNVEGK